MIAVAGHCEVYMDGGIRRGTGALMALALVGAPALDALTPKLLRYRGY